MLAINEAKERAFMTTKEEKLKKQLIDFLRTGVIRDKFGRAVGKQFPPHAKFAERLKDFDVNIVPIKADPHMTAAMSFDDATIYIGEGFLIDPKYFYQLNVLLRHELAHYLMNHQIKMMAEFEERYGKEGWLHMKASHALHDLDNIIADFEISNKRYTADDKQIVRNMISNHRLIGGLVTEDHRQAWENMSYKEMYQALIQEIERIENNIRSGWTHHNAPPAPGTKGDIINDSRRRANFYTDEKAPTNFLGSIDKFLDNKALYHFFIFDGMGPCLLKFSSLSQLQQDIIQKIYDEYATSSKYTKQMLKDFIHQIATSGIYTPINLKDATGDATIVSLYTPEEKLLASDALKAIAANMDLRKTWYDKALRVLSDAKYSNDDLSKILKGLK